MKIFRSITNTYAWVLMAGLALLSSCLPPSDPYPHAPADEVLARAEALSEGLENYIEQWLDGNVGPNIPDSLIPEGISDSKDFYLKRPEEVSPEEVWATRFAKPINQDSLLGGIPDPKITYLFLGTALAPFGSKMIVEGAFPHCRFFSFQITAALDGVGYYAGREFGGAEVSVVDADIEPLAGHTNPFRLGADRNAVNRSYRMTFDLIAGDPVTPNEGAFVYPYRGGSPNKRAGALMVYQGPLGRKNFIQEPQETPGDWNLGAFWVRIYHPDQGQDALGGVAMPKVYFELPDGRPYFIGSDFSKLQERADLSSKNQEKEVSPNNNFGPAVGWYKSWGITRSLLAGVCQSNGWSRRDSGQRVRDIDLGWTGRGEFQAAPHNYEPHATTNNYINYLGRSVDIPSGKVLVLTGKMPTFPETVEGQPLMTGGQLRYWSLSGIDQDPLSPLPATTIHSICDDEVILDDQRNYIIAYSQPADRPSNAEAAQGVSWVNSGTQTNHGILMRWLGVQGEWASPFGPDEEQLNWAVSDWAGSQYDSTLIGVNWRQGHMKCFLPRVHLLDKSEFEALGNDLRAKQIPIWVDSSFAIGPAESRLAEISATSVFDTMPANQADNALDGNISTSWSSGFGVDTVSLTLDFDSVRTISAIKLFWDLLFFAKAYSIDYSVDNNNWQTLLSNNDGDGLIDLYDQFQGIQARYLRLTCTRANLSWYTLAEFEVYTSDCDCGDQLITSTKTIQEISQEPQIELSVFPNPTPDLLHFRIAPEHLPSLRGYRLFNASGAMIDAVTTLKTQKIDMSGLAPGIYFLIFEGTNWSVSKRIIKT